MWNPPGLKSRPAYSVQAPATTRWGASDVRDDEAGHRPSQLRLVPLALLDRPYPGCITGRAVLMGDLRETAVSTALGGAVISSRRRGFESRRGHPFPSNQQLTAVMHRLLGHSAPTCNRRPDTAGPRCLVAVPGDWSCFTRASFARCAPRTWRRAPSRSSSAASPSSGSRPPRSTSGTAPGYVDVHGEVLHQTHPGSSSPVGRAGRRSARRLSLGVEAVEQSVAVSSMS
jgi:hypothetical protein